MENNNKSQEKMYKWEDDSKFVLTGNEFALIINTIQNELSTPEARRIISLNNCFNILSKKLEEESENNNVKVTNLIS
jgi:hypothetical protein